MPLTDVQARTAKHDATRTLKLSDGGGLQLWIMGTGGKLWCLAYRFEGKQRKFSIGPYPRISIKAAREARDAAKKLLASGIDPGQQKRVEANKRATAGANTFDAIADELLAHKLQSELRERTMVKARWLLGLARPALGNRPIDEITSADVLAVLRPILARGRHETARKLRAKIGACFRLAIADGRATSDPTLALRGGEAFRGPDVVHRAAITDEREFGGLLRAIDGYSGTVEVRIALQLLALTFARPGELRAAEWSEIDEEKATWTVPASRMKQKREHRVPLAPQALALLRDLHRLTGHGALLFPSVRSAVRPMSDGTFNAALRRLGFAQDEMTAHGFRAAASTILNEAGIWNPDAIEAQLAHADKDAVRRAYHRARYWDERVRLMAAWADQLDRMRQGGRVVAFAA